MATRKSVEGIDSLLAMIDECKLSQDVYVLFCGGVDAATGHSWCPDCVKAEPVIEEGLKKTPENSIFIFCSVGGRDYWKDLNNDFRKNPQFKLTAVPTLLKLGTSKRLVEEECASEELVNMLFEDD
ncbi:thioredoxin domain-containing protein 17-like [Anneissia japonica]|uniref:thioredoxin domain-containing protein 17-like n=1 Tax=Anneissia japonica TaxID=1529436 RepID=UPI0014258201|nr:thioredoxin domain-containing protein 17-like [Anneissia japonica]